MFLSLFFRCLIPCENSHLDEPVEIMYCVFEDIHKNDGGNGGVIFCSSLQGFLSISRTLFIDCSCSMNGGSIYVDTLNSFSLERVCAHNCKGGSESKYQFCAVWTKVSMYNNMTFVSISKCPDYPENRDFSLKLFNGYQNCINTNYSKCRIRCHGISFGVSDNLHSAFIASYNNIVDNVCSGYVTYDFDFRDNSGDMLYSNIIQNIQQSGSYGVVYVNTGHVKLDYCVLRNNNQVLLYIYQGSLRVINSFVYHNGGLSGGNVIVSNCTQPPHSNFSHNIVFYECEREQFVYQSRNFERNMYKYLFMIHIMFF